MTMIENLSWLQITLALSGAVTIALAVVGLSVLRKRVIEYFEAQRRSVELISRAVALNLKKVREVGDTVHHIHDNGLEQLRFQKAAHDQQRVMIASLTRQMVEIAKMLEKPAPDQGRHAAISKQGAYRQVAAGTPIRRISPPSTGILVGAEGASNARVHSLEEWFMKSADTSNQAALSSSSEAGRALTGNNREAVSISRSRLMGDFGNEQERAVANG